MHKTRYIVDNGLWLRLGADFVMNTGYVCEERARTDVTPHQLLVEQLSMLLSDAAAADGVTRCRPDKTLPQILRDAADTQLRPATEEIDGHTTQALECTDVQYRYTLWLDPEAGYLPRRIWARHAGAEGWDLSIHVLSFATAGGRMLPDAMRTVSEYTAKSGRKSQIRSDIQRWNIDLSPDFKAMGAFRMVAPPNYHIENHNFDPARQWQLRDGKVVTADSSRGAETGAATGGTTAAGPLAAPKSVGPLAGLSWVRWLAISVIVVAVSCLLAWRRQPAREKQ